MPSIKIFIVDDHKIFRDGLKMMLETIPDVKVTGEAPNGKVFIDCLSELDADIIFMDINMREMDGLEATQKALSMKPELKIVALTSFEDEEFFNRMTDLGVRGYLLKNSLREDFERAISKVSQGYNFYSDELVVKLSKKMAQYSKERSKPEQELVFNEEEKELLKYICQGLTNKQIADLLHLSSRTIEAHRARLLDKTETKNSVALAVYAISNNIISL